jgi:hypothetical protein
VRQGGRLIARVVDWWRLPFGEEEEEEEEEEEWSFLTCRARGGSRSIVILIRATHHKGIEPLGRTHELRNEPAQGSNGACNAKKLHQPSVPLKCAPAPAARSSGKQARASARRGVQCMSCARARVGFGNDRRRPPTTTPPPVVTSSSSSRRPKTMHSAFSASFQSSQGRPESALHRCDQQPMRPPSQTQTHIPPSGRYDDGGSLAKSGDTTREEEREARSSDSSEDDWTASTAYKPVGCCCSLQSCHCFTLRHMGAPLVGRTSCWNGKSPP